MPYNFTVEGNQFETNQIGFNGYTGDDAGTLQSYGFHLHNNTFRDNRIGAQLTRVGDCSLRDNIFEANLEAAICLISDPGVPVGYNRFQSNCVDVEERRS